MSLIWFWKLWKWVRENAPVVAISLTILAAGCMGWIGRGRWDESKLLAAADARRACEAEVVVWKGAADANDRSRAQLEETLRTASKEWARVAEELNRASAAQRADLAAASKRNDDLWARYRDSLTAMLPADCEGAVRETARRMREVAR